LGVVSRGLRFVGCRLRVIDHLVEVGDLRSGVGRASEDDLVFSTSVGTPIDAGNFLRNTHYPLLERIGLPRVRFHDLRHTAATLLLEAGAHPRVVANGSGMQRLRSS
jgi:integrase